LHLLDHTANRLQRLNLPWYPDWFTAQSLAIGVAFALAGLAIICIGLNLVTVEPIKRKPVGPAAEARKPKSVTAMPAKNGTGCWFEQQWAVQLCIVIPLVLAAALFTDRFGQFMISWGILNHPWSLPPFIGLAIYFGQWVGACFVMDIGLYFFGKRYGLTSANAPTGWIVLLTAAITGTAVGYLFLPFAHVLISPQGVPYRRWHVMAFGVPVEIVIMLLAGVLHIGLMGRDFRDAHREWWGRLGGWLLLYALGWFFLFQIAIYFPWGLGRLYHWEVLRHGNHPVTISSVALWALSTAYGVLFGKSKDTSAILSGDEWKQKVPAYVARATPYIFILGMLLALSLFADVLAVRVAGDGKSFLRHPNEWAYSVRIPLLCACLFLVALVFSWRVDINEFSIHYLYRNRLIRCYLGASVPERHGQPFTGFSEDDNLPLRRSAFPRERSTRNTDGRYPSSIPALTWCVARSWRCKRARRGRLPSPRCFRDLRVRALTSASGKLSTGPRARARPRCWARRRASPWEQQWPFPARPPVPTWVLTHSPRFRF
jgi:hypothetical protein